MATLLFSTIINIFDMKASKTKICKTFSVNSADVFKTLYHHKSKFPILEIFSLQFRFNNDIPCGWFLKNLFLFHSILIFLPSCF